MIAVVTGGGGFIGQNLVRRLLAEGHEVRCLVREGGAGVAAAHRFIVQFDEPRTLLNTPALEGADVVFHLAAATKAVRPEAFFTANVTPTRHLLGALTARRLRPRFVFVSSEAAAGPAISRERPVDEDDVPRPVEAYGRSKLEAERVVESFSDRLPTTIARPSAVFGAHDRDFLTLFRFAERGIILYPGTAEHWLSLVHVDDVVAGLMAAAQSDRAISRTYFLASQEPVQWRALGAHIAASVGKHVRHVDVYRPIIQTASLAGEWLGRLTRRATLASRSKAELSRHRFWICSAARARVELGFRESRSLPESLRATYLWYRQSGWMRGSRRADTAVA